jgi:OmpA-OmpF porin, OOP family
MKKSWIALAMLLVIAVHADHAVAQEQDAEGCKDSPLVTRFPGSVIHSCDTKEFERAEMPVAKDQTKAVEGAFKSWDYGTREGLSEIQVFRNFDGALKRAGFTIDYEDTPSTITAHKGDTWYMLENKGTYYYQTIVTVMALNQEVTADASSLADEIKKSGHVAVYGINFDTGKANILPDSERMLGEIAKLLDQDAALKLRVEGHTDNQGTAASNQTLSERRAQAVVAWLVAHGVSASRLTSAGFGQTKPVADNQTDAGRAKNRRVELVKP